MRAEFYGLGAFPDVALAPFDTPAERRAYFAWVQEMRDQQAQREDDEADAYLEEWRP